MAKEDTLQVQLIIDAARLAIVEDVRKIVHEKTEPISDMKTDVALIKRDIMGNGSPGIKDVLKKQEKRIDILEKKENEKKDKQIQNEECQKMKRRAEDKDKKRFTTNFKLAFAAFLLGPTIAIITAKILEGLFK